MQNAINALINGGVVILPTDTVYGIACDAFCNSAKQKIYRIKQRSNKKHLPFIFSNFLHLSCFAKISLKQELIIKSLLPGPFTFILKSKLPAKKNVPQKIAARIPNCKLTTKLVKRFNRPIVATSANLSGKKEIKKSKEITQYFKSRVDCVLTSDQSPSGRPSVILDLSQDKIKIIRGDKAKIIKLLKHKENLNLVSLLLD